MLIFSFFLFDFDVISVDDFEKCIMYVFNLVIILYGVLFFFEFKGKGK